VIYCDFSGYTDIAIGLAALLGYRFQRNFNQPYRAESLREFWRRWHISLSTWLRDYLYIPLGGSRSGERRTYLSLLLTMLLGGLWHGAAWHFVAWGAFHGGALAVERAAGGGGNGKPDGSRPRRSRLRRLLAVAATFHVVCVGWIFFRAESMAHAGYVLAALVSWSRPPRLLTPPLITLIAIGIAIQFTPPDMLERLDRVYHRLPTWIVGVLAGAALLAIEALGGGVSAPFIYFQF
jgi:alginate O-acetyltransferase complex protein AlgI